MRKLSFISQAIATGAFALSLFASALPVSATTWVTLSAGDLIKLPDDGNTSTNVDTAIYYFGKDGLRYVFPNSKTYFTWYSGFSGIKVVTMEQLGSIGIGGNVTYRPGVKMIKIESDPKVYAISAGGTRRWVATEAVAVASYGSNWNTKIDDVPDAFFSNYPLGDDIESAGDYSASGEMSDNPNISEDKNMSSPVEISINADGSFSPSTATITVGRTVRWTNRGTTGVRVASDPHPAHDALPGFDSAGFIQPDLNYVYKFKAVGTWGFHNHQSPTNQGTITVTP